MIDVRWPWSEAARFIEAICVMGFELIRFGAIGFDAQKRNQQRYEKCMHKSSGT